MSDSSLSPNPRDRRVFNAYRHGLSGHVLVITPGEQAAYEKHCRGIHQSLAPSGAMETDLVQSIADDRWRIKRAAAMESNLFAIALDEPDQIVSHHEETDVALAMARTWLERGANIQLLTLYESRLQRKVEKNFALLRQMQQDRRDALRTAAEEARLLAQRAAAKGETFDPECDFPREVLPPQFDFSNAQIARLAAHLNRIACPPPHPQGPSQTLCHAA